MIQFIYIKILIIFSIKIIKYSTISIYIKKGLILSQAVHVGCHVTNSLIHSATCVLEEWNSAFRLISSVMGFYYLMCLGLNLDDEFAARVDGARL